ncbi:probable protein, unknown function [Plasmodium sp. DRC-Itaito]|nr:probable protein, unknown function [Plasmodium sp. DRC-Itaito]
MRISKHLFRIGRKQNISCRKSKKKNIFSTFDYFVNTNFNIFKRKWLKFIMKNKSNKKVEDITRCYSDIDGNIEQNAERRKENEKVLNYILFDEMHKKKKEKKNMVLKDHNNIINNNHNNYHNYHYHNNAYMNNMHGDKNKINNNNLTIDNFFSNQIVIYNVTLKNDIINDIHLEVIFFDLDILSNVILNNSYDCMITNYLQIFYKKLKCAHMKNKLINLYTSKVNNIYSNLLFYHTYKNKKNFLLHTSMYKQFSHTLKNMLKNKLDVNVFTYQFIPNEKKKKTYTELIQDDNIINDKNLNVNMNIIHIKQKYIHNYLFKMINNIFIYRFIYLYNKKEKNKNFGHIKENVNKMKVCRKNVKNNIISYFYLKKIKKKILINKRFRYKFTRLRSLFFNHLKSYKKKTNNIKHIYNTNNLVHKHIYNSKIQAYKNIFSNFNLVKLNYIFFKFNNKSKAQCKDILNINYEIFIHTLINKRKEKKKYFLLFIKYYKELFNVNDIFIIDKENVKKNFFFFFYHSLIGGPSFFFSNKEKQNESIICNNIPKKKYTKKKKMKMKMKMKMKILYTLYNKTNYTPNISFLFGKRKNNKIINLKIRIRRKPYFINLNNNQLKYNSTDNYIIFFLYDLIFNHNFDIYKYMYTYVEREEEKHTHNSFICTFKKNRIKKESKKLNNILKDKIKDGRIILFTNDKKLQSMCFKINIFYQNVFNMLKCNNHNNNKNYDGPHHIKNNININKKLIKLYVFSDKILFGNTPITNNNNNNNNNKNNVKKVDHYELYSFSKSFMF